MNGEDIATAATKFQNMYSGDIEPQFLHFRNFVREFNKFWHKEEPLQTSDIYLHPCSKKQMWVSFFNSLFEIPIWYSKLKHRRHKNN